MGVRALILMDLHALVWALVDSKELFASRRIDDPQSATKRRFGDLRDHSLGNCADFAGQGGG